MIPLSAKELCVYLQSVFTNAKKIDKLKIIYRPYICPFSDLILECDHSQSIFDIGCGSGQFLLLLSKFTSARKLGGIEISSTLVTNAKGLLCHQNKSSFQIEIYDGKNIPDFVREFETITLIDVFHHIKKNMQERFIFEIYKKMKVGDKLIFKDINAAHPFVFANKIHDLFLGGGIGNEVSVLRAKQLLINAGFDIISVSKKTMIWYPHYTVICKK